MGGNILCVQCHGLGVVAVEQEHGNVLHEQLHGALLGQRQHGVAVRVAVLIHFRKADAGIRHGIALLQLRQGRQLICFLQSLNHFGIGKGERRGVPKLMELAYLQRRRGKGHIRCVKLPAIQRFLCSRVIDGVVDALLRALHMDVFAVVCQIQLFRFNLRLRFLLCPPFPAEQAVEAFQQPMRAVVDADLVCQLDEILQLLPQLCVLTGKQPVRHRLRCGFVRAVGNVQTPAQERRVVGGEGQRVGA